MCGLFLQPTVENPFYTLGKVQNNVRLPRTSSTCEERESMRLDASVALHGSSQVGKVYGGFMKSFVRIFFLLSLVFLATSLAYSQQPTSGAPKPVVSKDLLTIPLWENGAPGALGHDDSDIPMLTYYPAAHGSPTAMIIAPGGGYRGLEMNYEGRQVANWFNAAGISAFILKYRLGPRYHHPIELGDAQRAIRFVRAHATDYGLKPDRIGMLGFSAGGHLTSTAETHFDNGNPNAADPIDRVSARPDFAVLCYAAVSMTEIGRAHV